MIGEEESHRDDAGSVWRAYGLRGNPFFQDELEPDPKGDHPVKLLFVGRWEELEALDRVRDGESHSRVVVEGPVGVGKTSLVNRIKAGQARNLLSQDDPVPVMEGMTPRDFLAEVLRGLLRIRSELHGEASLFGSAKEKTSELVDKKRRATSGFWREAARVVNGVNLNSPSMQGGVSGVVSLGAGVSRSRAAADVPADSLHPLVAEAVERLTKESNRDILIHVNNLENLSLKNERDAAALMLNVRASLTLPKVHWIFVGTTGTDRNVFRAHDQVAGFFADPIVLDPLAPAEVAKMLAARYHYLKRGVRYVAPVEPENAAEVYKRFSGDLRNFLRLMSDASKRYLGVEGVRPLTAQQIVDYMAPVCAARLEREMGTALFGNLVRVLEKNDGAAEFRVTDVKDRLGVTQAAASQAVQQLLFKKVIIPSHTEGRNKYFRPSGEVSIALRLGGNASRLALKPQTAKNIIK